MAEHVIILGAGASAQVGAPVMANFLDVAQELYVTGRVPPDARQSFARVFVAISELQAVHSKCEDFDLDNIESIFTAFQLAKLTGSLPNITSVPELIDDLKRLIVVTLEQTIKFPVKDKEISPHAEYLQLSDALYAAFRQHPPVSVAVLTFNYDVALDMAVDTQFRIDYGFDPPGGQHVLPVLKLHGSLNWSTGIGGSEPQILAWPLREYVTRYSNNIFPEVTAVSIPIGSHLTAWAKDRAAKGAMQIDGLPVIVPPSWITDGSHQAISRVWSRAAQELRGAANIYVIGYSLPATDAFFRQLYALGTLGPVRLKRFWVFNPDTSRRNTFLSMLGPGARARFRFEPIAFDASVGILREALLSRRSS